MKPSAPDRQRVAADVVAGDPHPPRIGAEQRHQRAQHGALARAVRPHEAHDLARVDLEAHPAQDLALAEAVAELLDGDHRWPPSPWVASCPRTTRSSAPDVGKGGSLVAPRSPPPRPTVKL